MKTPKASDPIGREQNLGPKEFKLKHVSMHGIKNQSGINVPSLFFWLERADFRLWIQSYLICKVHQRVYWIPIFLERELDVKPTSRYAVLLWAHRTIQTILATPMGQGLTRYKSTYESITIFVNLRLSLVSK